jgi:hypothetical protein
MIKYLFSIPFRPKANLVSWQKAYIKNEKRNEQTMLLFVLVSSFLIGTELFYHYISIKTDNNWDHILFTYIEITVSTVLIYFSFQLFTNRKEDDLSRLKWLNVYLLSTGFWLILSNFFYALLRDIDLRVYLVITFLFQIISAIYLMKGMLICNETDLEKSKWTTKVAVTFRYVKILVVCKFLASIISGRYYL